MRNDITDISVDDAVTMMAYVAVEYRKRAGQELAAGIIKDSFALALRYEHTFDIDDLYNQVIERAAVLEGVV